MRNTKDDPAKNQFCTSNYGVILEAVCVPKTSDKTGPIRSGFVKLSGTQLNATLHNTHQEDGPRYQLGFREGEMAISGKLNPSGPLEQRSGVVGTWTAANIAETKCVIDDVRDLAAREAMSVICLRMVREFLQDILRRDRRMNIPQFCSLSPMSWAFIDDSES
jgi:hypothetical protein